MSQVTFTLGSTAFPDYATVTVTEVDNDAVGGTGQDLQFEITVDTSVYQGDVLGVFFDLPYTASTISVYDSSLNLVGASQTDTTLPWLLPTGGDNNVNMNGDYVDYFNDASNDLAVQVGIQGSQAGFITTTTLYLSGGIADLSLADFLGDNFLGLRVQSVGLVGETNDASLKLAADIPDVQAPPPMVEFCFDGLSQGFWSQHSANVYNKNGQLVRSNAWDDGYLTTDKYDAVFGVNAFGSGLNDKTLLQAITTDGGGEAALARQAVGALLNSVSGNDGLVADYRYGSAEIINAVKFVYNGSTFNISSDRDSDGVADWLELKDELEHWNTAHDQIGYVAGEGLCIELPQGTQPQGLLAQLGWDAVV